VIAKRFLLPFLLLLLMIGGASAQLAGEKVRQPWLMLSKLTSPISVTTSSAATQLPSMGLELWACNTGTFDAYLGFGTANTVSVTVATGSWLRAGGCAAYDLYPPGNAAPYTYVAAIGSGGSTTIYLEAGVGQPPLETNVVVSGTVTTGPYAYTPLSPSQNGLTVASATALTIPTGATYAVVCIEGAAIRYTWDGTTTPTASVGSPIAAGSCAPFSGAAILANLKFIQVTATATIDVEYAK
jgi:hypothetical protein